MKQTILKIMAWTMFIFSSLLSLGILSSIFFLSVWIKGGNLMKMVTIDLAIIIVALGVFVLGLGILEFILSFIKIETEVEEIEDKLGTDGQLDK